MVIRGFEEVVGLKTQLRMKQRIVDLLGVSALTARGMLLSAFGRRMGRQLRANRRLSNSQIITYYVQYENAVSHRETSA